MSRQSSRKQEALPATESSHVFDRVEAIFDDPNLVANAGLIVPATVMTRLGLENVVNDTVRLVGRVGGAMPGRRIATLAVAILVGATHIDHANVLRAGATQAVLPFRVMAPSTLGTFLRSFTFGHIRQLDKVIAEMISRAWATGAERSAEPMMIDVDSTICEVHGKAKQGAGYGYTRVLGYHPLLATRADTGEVLHARLRKGSAKTQRGVKRLAEELVDVAGRQRVPQRGPDHPSRSPQGEVVDHREPQCRHQQGNLGDCRRCLDRHFLPRRRRGAGR